MQDEFTTTDEAYATDIREYIMYMSNYLCFFFNGIYVCFSFHIKKKPIVIFLQIPIQTFCIIFI